MSNPDDRCMRCGSERRSHDTHPNDPHRFVEPLQPAPTLSTFNQVLAALRNPSVDLGDLDVCKACLSVESPYLHSAGTACPTGPTVDVPQPAPSGDEAKVRETTPELRAVIERVLMLVSLGEPCDFRARLTEAFNLGARDERGACEKLIRARANVAFVITDLAAPRVRKALHNIADVIARRGSEGT